MDPNDTICYCFDVPLRKLTNFARRERPSHASRMTQCLEAGTGCGWCIPFLRKIAEQPDAFSIVDLSADEYADRRSTYIKAEQPKNRF